MHRFLAALPLIAMLGACAQPSGGVDWYEWNDFLEVAGLMRTDRGVTEPLPDAEALAANFAKIGFSVEGDAWEANNRQDDTVPRMLRRWERPLDYEILTLSTDGDFTRRVEGVMDRLARATGNKMGRIEATGEPGQGRMGDLLVVHASDDLLRYLISDGSPLRRDPEPERLEFKLGLLAQVAEWRVKRSPCTMLFWFAHEDIDGEKGEGPNSGARTRGELLLAIALIRAEMPAALLDACLEEELAQGMGLLADHEDLRPSIFNDDQEHALLTRQDELLLKILYDPRLSPGMTPEVAMPIVRQIARELTGGA